MKIDLEKLQLDDATIKEIKFASDKMEILYLDWTGKNLKLIFNDVTSCHLYSPIGKTISHGIVESNIEFLKKECENANEEMSITHKIFNFFDSWGGINFIKIVAESVEIEE